MNITILGSGSFFVDSKHSAPGYLLEVDDKNILLDCGPGTQNQLAKINFDPLDLDYILITHFHNDHTSDLLAILMRAYIYENFYGGKLKGKIKIIGPKGIHKFVEILANTQGHSGVVTFDKLEFIEFEKEMDFENFVLKTFSVEHLGLDAFALRIESGNRTVTYTGDATLCQGVLDASSDADLLITDCATPKDKVPSAHLSSSQVGEICRKGNVKKVVLSHQVPPGYNVDMVGQVREVYSGEVLLAEDLMALEV